MDISRNVPGWLPDEYLSMAREMMTVFNLAMYRSTIALASIILDAHVNSLLKSSTDKSKPLKAKLEVLQALGIFDADQFADATVTRLTRNPVMHPKELEESVTLDDAKEAMESVISCLERYYKFRRSKALPAPPSDETKSGQIPVN